MRLSYLAGLLVLTLSACGNDANDRGVGATCAMDTECTEEGQRCLTQFKGGYCGLQGCEGDADCPEASACILHEDGETYCFRICIDKPDCNENRDLDNEANCSSSAEFVDGANGRKACVPPSGS